MKRYRPGWTAEDIAEYEAGYANGSIPYKFNPTTDIYAAMFLSTTVDHPWWYGCKDGVIAAMGTRHWVNPAFDQLRAHMAEVDRRMAAGTHGQ